MSGLVTGPLGGANFLSVQDYNSIDPLSPGKNAISLFQKGTDLASSRVDLESKQLALDEQKKSSQELADYAAARWGSTNAQPVAKPVETASVQAPAQAEPAPIASAPTSPTTPTTMAAAPAPAPATPAAPITPVAQAAVAQAPTVQPGAAPSTAQQAQTAPAPVVEAQAPATPDNTEAPAPAAPAQATVQTAATATPAPSVESVRAMPAINGAPNPMSISKVDQDKQILTDLVNSGKMRPQTAQAIFQAQEASRMKDAERVVELHKKIAEIDDKTADADKKRIEIAKEMRSQEDNRFNDVYTTLKTLGPGAAAVLAKDKGMNLDLSNPKDLLTLESRAKRSPDYKSASEEDRKANELKPVPGVAGAFYNPKGKVVDADGKPLSQKEVTAHDLSGKKAGATNVSVGTSSVTGEPIPKGAVRLVGVKADDQIKAGENLESSRQVIEDAMRMKQLYPKVVAASGIDPNDSQFKAKFKTWLSANWDNNDATREYKSRSQRMVNSNLRLNKGAQTEGDAQREREALASADMPPSAHNSMLDSIVKRANRQAKGAQSIQRGYLMPGEDKDNLGGAGPSGNQSTADIDNKWGAK